MDRSTTKQLWYSCAIVMHLKYVQHVIFPCGSSRSAPWGAHMMVILKGWLTESAKTVEKATRLRVAVDVIATGWRCFCFFSGFVSCFFIFSFFSDVVFDVFLSIILCIRNVPIWMVDGQILNDTWFFMVPQFFYVVWLVAVSNMTFMFHDTLEWSSSQLTKSYFKIFFTPPTSCCWCRKCRCKPITITRLVLWTWMSTKRLADA